MATQGERISELEKELAKLRTGLIVSVTAFGLLGAGLLFNFKSVVEVEKTLGAYEVKAETIFNKMKSSEIEIDVKVAKSLAHHIEIQLPKVIDLKNRIDGFESDGIITATKFQLPNKKSFFGLYDGVG